MEFKRCARCGCFFLADDSVCCNCKPKDNFDNLKLKNFLEESSKASSLEELSIDTGISIKNLSRYIESGNYDNYIENTDNGISNISISL